nr:MAG TPA_asm: hypothetical protein [Caudoviricetes sp.]
MPSLHRPSVLNSSIKRTKIHQLLPEYSKNH